MPEKQAWWEYVVVPIVGWLGYIQTNKVSKSTFQTYLEQHDKVHTEQCKKIDDVHEGVKRIEGFLMQGGTWDGGERRKYPRE